MQTTMQLFLMGKPSIYFSIYIINIELNVFLLPVKWMNFGFGLCNDFSLAKKTPLKYESIFFGPYYLMSYISVS
jgi:hypothetical protein